MRMTHKFTAIVCAFLLAWMPTAVHAEETSIDELPSVELSTGKISQLSKGQRAPFAGVLFSNDAAARLYADIKFSEEECQLRLKKELELNSLQLGSHLDALRLRFDVENERTTSLLQIRDERIKYLELNFMPTPWYESGEFWFAFGVVAGIAITAVSAYAIGQAAE